MQKKKKYAILICCILLVAFTLSLLPGEVLGKYIKVFDEIGAIVVPKNYYTITIVDNYDPKEEIRVLIDYEEGYTLSGAIETYLTETEIDGRTFQYWVYAGGGTVDSNKDDGSIDHTIPAGHTTDVVIYPKWADEYWLRFLDGLGNDEENVILAYNISTDEGVAKFNTDRDDLVFTNILKSSVTIGDVTYDSVQSRWDAVYDPAIEPYVVSGWSHDISTLSVDNPTGDIIVTAVGAPAEYDGNLTFTGNDSDGDGIPETFSVSGVSANDVGLAEIPEYYQGQKVTAIASGTFAGFDNIHAVTIPDSIKSIGANAFVASTSGRQQITLYYDGDKDTFRQHMDKFYVFQRNDSKYISYNGQPNEEPDIDTMFLPSWDHKMGQGSRIFFLGDDGKVDENAGYWELYKETWSETYTWIYHQHKYVAPGSHKSEPIIDAEGNEIGGTCSKNYHSSIFSDVFTDYDGNCDPDCPICEGELRPDAIYWTDVATASEEETP